MTINLGRQDLESVVVQYGHASAQMGIRTAVMVSRKRGVFKNLEGLMSWMKVVAGWWLEITVCSYAAQGLMWELVLPWVVIPCGISVVR